MGDIRIMATLDRCTGPECPRCGCRDVEILRMPADAGWWNGMGKAWCRHCDRFFHFRRRQSALTVSPEQDGKGHAAPSAPSSGEPDALTTAPPVEHREPTRQSTRNPLKCPECGGRGLVKTTRKGIQHRKCRECGHTYKTEKVS